jgi:hypothetical protein
MMKAIHKSRILVSSREKASFVRTRRACSIPPLHLHLHTILLLFYLICKYAWICEYVTRKSKNWENFGVMGVGINMPLLIAVCPVWLPFLFTKQNTRQSASQWTCKICACTTFSDLSMRFHSKHKKARAKMNSLPSSFKNSYQIIL